MGEEFMIFENEEEAKAKIDELEDDKLFPHPAFDSLHGVAKKKRVVAKRGAELLKREGESKETKEKRYEILALTKSGDFVKYQEG